MQQIAIGGADKTALEKLWINTLGCEKISVFTSASENVDETICKLGAGAATVEVDLMKPLDPAKKPDPSTPALNHVGLWVDDIRAAVTALTASGVRFAPGGIRKGAAGFEVCFIHPKGSKDFPLSGEGVLIELVQAPPDVIKAFDDAAAAAPSPKKTGA